MKSYTSDSFPIIIEMAEKLIKEGHAYMDNTDQETMRNERQNRINSKNREMPADQSMELFHKLLKGEVTDYCLRAKINMQSENGTMRDPVIFRYNILPHMRTGDKYKAYPTYDLACPIVDSIEGVTHAMRTTEYKDRDEQYAWLQKTLGLRPVHIIEFGRLNFQQTVMSKRKLQLLVDRGEVSGWDDPRFPTVKGIIKRGVQISALKKFILAQGFSKNIVEMEWNKFWTLNKKEIDPIAPRYMAVLEKSVIELRVSNVGDKITTVECDLHPKNASLGKKIIQCSNVIYLEEADAKDIKEGEEITLMRWGNFKVTSIHKTGDKIEYMEGEFVPNGDFKKTEKKLTWVAKTPENTKITLVEFDYLITKKKLDDDAADDDFESCLTSKIHPTRVEAIALSDPNIKAIKTNDIIQLERKGYFRVEEKTDSSIVLYMIPDGHEQAMSTIMADKK